MIYGTVRQVVASKKKGQFANMVYEKQLKTLKNVQARVEKHTEMMVRFGIDYDKIGKVQDKRELGILPSQNAGLPWGQWVEEADGSESHFIEHKGNKYLRAYPLSGNIPKTTYYVDGVEVDKDTAKALCLASEFRTSEGGVDCVTIGVDKIISIK
jgi:hypothetical protein